MPSASQLYGGRLLNAADLQPIGQRRVAVIHDCDVEMLGQGSDQKSMLILGLVSQQGQAWPKRCPLNKTNTMMLVAAYGDDYATWPGKPIEIWSELVMFQGKMIPGIKLAAAPATSAVATTGIAPAAGPTWRAADPGDLEDDSIPF